MTRIIGRMAVAVAALVRLLLAPEAAMAQCCGDCNGDGQSTVDEILKGVNHALTSCSDDGICDTSVASCNTNLAKVQTNLDTCNTNLSSAQASLTTCNEDVSTCTTNLAGTQASLTTCNTSLGACSTDLARCQSQSGAQRFPATGQTTCSNAAGTVIACGGTGQDGEIQAGGALAYVDNGDGTITDLNTHLMWEKKSADGSVHDWTKLYVWADALGTFIDGLNAAGVFAGHTDWRVPNYKELVSILNLQTANPAVSALFNTACASGCTVTSCSCTQPDFYWSATTRAAFPVNAWYVDPFAGFVGTANKTKGNYVRAVRGGL